MSQTPSCACGAAPTLIFACSGAADVGAIADHAARRLTASGWGKMFCLAGIGGKVPGILKTTESAAKILAIDGCPLDCARLSLEQAGFKSVQHLRLTDIGLEKGKSPLSEDYVVKAVTAAQAKLG
jgi:uncharacterized metal-binding protein